MDKVITNIWAIFLIGLLLHSCADNESEFAVLNNKIDLSFSEKIPTGSQIELIGEYAIIYGRNTEYLAQVIDLKNQNSIFSCIKNTNGSKNYLSDISLNKIGSKGEIGIIDWDKYRYYFGNLNSRGDSVNLNIDFDILNNINGNLYPFEHFKIFNNLQISKIVSYNNENDIFVAQDSNLQIFSSLPKAVSDHYNNLNISQKMYLKQGRMDISEDKQFIYIGFNLFGFISIINTGNGNINYIYPNNKKKEWTDRIEFNESDFPTQNNKLYIMDICASSKGFYVLWIDKLMKNNKAPYILMEFDNNGSLIEKWTINEDIYRIKYSKELKLLVGTTNDDRWPIVGYKLYQ